MALIMGRIKLSEELKRKRVVYYLLSEERRLVDWLVNEIKQNTIVAVSIKDTVDRCQS